MSGAVSRALFGIFTPARSAIIFYRLGSLRRLRLLLILLLVLLLILLLELLLILLFVLLLIILRRLPRASSA